MGRAGGEIERGDALAPLPVLKSRLLNLPKPPRSISLSSQTHKKQKGVLKTKNKHFQAGESLAVSDANACRNPKPFFLPKIIRRARKTSHLFWIDLSMHSPSVTLGSVFIQYLPRFSAAKKPARNVSSFLAAGKVSFFFATRGASAKKRGIRKNKG